MSDPNVEPFLKSQAHLNNNNGYDKIKLATGIQQIKEVTSASSGLVYVCFGSYVKCSRVHSRFGNSTSSSIVVSAIVPVRP